MPFFRCQRWIGLLLAAASVVFAEESPSNKERARQWVAELDSDRFQVRQRAESALSEMGESALAALEEGLRHSSLEVRSRARRVEMSIRYRVLRSEFVALAAQGDEMDLESALFHVARIVSPQAKREAISKRIDELAAEVRAKLGKEVDPAEVDPRRVMAAICDVLFVQQGFDGNRTDYENPENSALDRVLETKKGLPILLSQVVVAVGRRLKLPIVGVPALGQYLVKYEGSRAPVGFPRNDIYLNPYEKGKILEPAEVAERIASEDGENLALRSRKGATLRRVLKNMLTHLEEKGRADEAALALEFHDMFIDESELDPFQ